MCVERTRSQLERADVILEAFDAGHEHLTLLGLVARTGLPKTTVHRTVKRMLELGWVECHHGRYTIGIRLFERAALATRSTSLRDAALQAMQSLRTATRETVHLAVLDGAEVVYLEKLTGHRPIGTSSRVGGRMPALCTALGKVLTAFHAEGRWSRVDVPVARTAHTMTDLGEIRHVLARARRERVAYDREEADLGVHCVAAPVIAPGGACVTLELYTDRSSPAPRPAPSTPRPGRATSAASAPTGSTTP
jgi:DNA-binding IclR family transcriptional regulator